MPFALERCGEEPGSPQYSTTPAGGVSVRRRLIVDADAIASWIIFLITNPIDPYTNCGNLWKINQVPFERQERTAADIATFGPGVCLYELAILEVEYESVGMRYYPGFGVVKEELKPRMQQEAAGVAKGYGTGNTVPDNLQWSSNDSLGSNAVYYGEHPRFEWGGGELIVTFPFAPTGNEVLSSGEVNSTPWTSFVLNNTFDSGTLKYIGPAMEASVAIPAVGIYTGLVRYRKSFLFHYRFIDWNKYWRARDQTWSYMKDLAGTTYQQYPPVDFSARNWWL